MSVSVKVLDVSTDASRVPTVRCVSAKKAVNPMGRIASVSVWMVDDFMLSLNMIKICLILSHIHTHTQMRTSAPSRVLATNCALTVMDHSVAIALMVIRKMANDVTLSTVGRLTISIEKYYYFSFLLLLF